ncbi:MAG: hypothetical protein J6X70_01285 [Muribaculaceae bacterium]|nr:hypothetical protein [Muribaculaceae bacterium]
MRKTITIVAVAMMALPATCLAANEADTDTVKVINNPKQVVITQSDERVLMNVKGNEAGDDYNYDYRVTSGRCGKVTGMEREGTEVEFRLPFAKSKSDADSLKRYRLYLFLSDVYLGAGSAHVEAAGRDALKKTVSEVGVLNFLALGYEFNQKRSRVSLGVGFNWNFYRLNDKYFWQRDDRGVVGFVPNLDSHDRQHATLSSWSVQFPLLYNHSLGKKWSVAAGVVMNWNCYADFTNSYRDGKSDYSVTTHGLYQRKLSFDCIGMVSWHGIGAYFRYSPQSLFKTGYGPEIKNRWTLGLVLRGL